MNFLKNFKNEIIFISSIVFLVVVTSLIIILIVSKNNTNIDKNSNVETIETEINETENESSFIETIEENSFSTEETKIDEESISQMYTTANVNIRTEPNTMSEIVTTLHSSKLIDIYDFSIDKEWNKILYDGNLYYINSEYISENKPVEATNLIPVKMNLEFGDDFHYYGIWSGDYWHFTPEQIDNQWAGYKKSKPLLEIGTTKAWQEYLYETLKNKNLSWWYKYACAQAMQESGFNPLNNASIDHGLFSFREKFWDKNYGDILDYHANINAYVDRIYPHLINVKNDDDIYYALSQHYNPDGKLHMGYVNSVLNRLNELWICD